MRTSFELSRRWRWILLLFSVIFKANNPNPALFLALSVGVFFLFSFSFFAMTFWNKTKKREGFGELNAFSHDPWYFDLSHFYAGIYFRVYLYVPFDENFGLFEYTDAWMVFGFATLRHLYERIFIFGSIVKMKINWEMVWLIDSFFIYDGSVVSLKNVIDCLYFR